MGDFQGEIAQTGKDLSYTLEIRSSARKDIQELPNERVKRIVLKIDGLKQNPRPAGVKKLALGLGWRIRVGDYRIVYEINDLRRIVTIARVKHRREAYR